jgi:hypothetical protein
MPDLLRPEDFRGLDAPLTVELATAAGKAAIELRVDSVQDLPPHRMREAPFSLVLKGPREPLLPQATYSLEHPGLGSIALFLVPIGQDREATRYEATFN